MPATRGSNKRGREEDQQSDASSAVSPATEFPDHLRGRPVWKKRQKEVKGLDDAEIDNISPPLYQDEEGGKPDRPPRPSFRPDAGRTAVDGDDDDDDDYPYETPGNEIVPYGTEEEERQAGMGRRRSLSEGVIDTDKWNSWDDGDRMSDDKFDEEDDEETGSAMADPDAWEAVGGSRPATRFFKWLVYLYTAHMLSFMVRMRMMGVDPFNADAIWAAGVREDVSHADAEGKEETRDNVNALVERLLEMGEQGLLEFYELAESYREDLLEQGVNIKGHIYNQYEGEKYY
ncbi:hypothetical protein DL764_006327 [Monosporascus ibericus]|uniref:Uncharacterized protein n=1 Tax=Monosporascus ibericus TaxID=155417 RepID=A0A4Q4T7I5_9PEZI|nr:hypothetical protein DL764_006327 [Monosporascus ibericus]